MVEGESNPVRIHSRETFIKFYLSILNAKLLSEPGEKNPLESPHNNKILRRIAKIKHQKSKI